MPEDGTKQARSPDSSQDTEEGQEKIQDLNLDAILKESGQFGLFQVKNYCLILFGIVFTALWLNQYIFNAGITAHRCVVPECEEDPPVFSTGIWGSFTLPPDGRCERYLFVPKEPISGRSGADSARAGSVCKVENFDKNRTVPCEAIFYEHNNTIVSAFNLACKDWKRTLVGSIHNAGLFIALPLTAFVSDTFGRRTAFILCATVGSVVGVLRATSVNYVMYLCFEFMESVTGAGLYSSGFVLALEMVGLERRVIGGNLISSVYALGQVTLALLAWANPYWKTLHLILYAPSLICLSYYWLMDESVRWMLSKGRYADAAKLIFKAARINKKKLSPETIKLLNQLPERSLQGGRAVKNETGRKRPSLFKQVIGSRTLVTRLMICSTWWITITFIYYGLSINSVTLAGNSYVNYILISLVEIPGYACSAMMLDRFGRKSSIIAAFFICSITLITLPFVDSQKEWLITTLTMTGKLCISMAFSSIYIYTSELIPTELRQSLLGFCSMVGRVGSLLAPQTPLLQKYWTSLPYMMFGVMAATSGMLMLLTPETLNMPLPDTVKQAEDIATAAKIRIPHQSNSHTDRSGAMKVKK